MTDQQERDDLRAAAARAVSEAGGAADWSHALEVAEAVIAALMSRSRDSATDRDTSIKE